MFKGRVRVWRKDIVKYVKTLIEQIIMFSRYTGREKRKGNWMRWRNDNGTQDPDGTTDGKQC